MGRHPGMSNSREPFASLGLKEEGRGVQENLGAQRRGIPTGAVVIERWSHLHCQFCEQRLGRCSSPSSCSLFSFSLIFYECLLAVESNWNHESKRAKVTQFTEVSISNCKAGHRRANLQKCFFWGKESNKITGMFALQLFLF